MRDITSEEVKKLWKYIQSIYKTKVINKSNSIEMKLVARVLDILNIANKNKFLNNSATTIRKSIYLPFSIGETNSIHKSLWHQIEICAHEHEHVLQYNRLGFLYEIPYLTSKKKRARFEAEAYRCHLELHFWRFGQLPPIEQIDQLAEHLKDYGCSSRDINAMKEKLHIWSKRIKLGKVYSFVSKEVIKWLEANCKDIRHI